MKALVTGGAGFIGSNLVDSLLARGDSVVVLDNLSTGCHGNLADAIEAGARLVVEDVRDARVVASLFEDERPDVVFHLAAQMDVRVSVAKPAFDAEVNVIGTLNVLEAARATGARRFVYASTGGAIYGEAEKPPCTEESAIAPEAPYGQAKFASEGYCALAQRLHGLSTVSLRLGNVYGPRQDPLGEAGVIAIFCGRLVGGERPIVYGDGRQTRDYIYVEDVVRALLIAAAGEQHGAFNVGRGVETSVLELVDVLRALGHEAGLAGADGFEPEFAPPRPGEVQRNALNPAKARRELRFEAEVGLGEGLRRTLASLTAST